MSGLYAALNIGSLNFVYTIALVHPTIPLLWKNKILPLYIALPITALFGLCILQAQYTIGLLIFLLSCVIYLLPRLFGKKQLGKLFFAIICTAPVLIMIPNLLVAIAHSDFMADFGSVSERLGDLGYMLQGSDLTMAKESDVESRTELVNRSITTFVKNPFGCFFFGGKGAGGHSKIFDTLANWGLLGLMVMVVYYKRLYKVYFSDSRNKPYYLILVYIFILVILLSSLNPSWWIESVCFYIPLVFKYIDMSTTENSLGQ